MTYQFLDAEAFEEVVSWYIKQDENEIARIKAANPDITDQAFKDYFTWQHFYEENTEELRRQKVFTIGHLFDARVPDEKVLNVSRICAPYYDRSVEEFARNVDRVDTALVSLRRAPIVR